MAGPNTTEAILRLAKERGWSEQVISAVVTMVARAEAGDPEASAALQKMGIPFTPIEAVPGGLPEFGGGIKVRVDPVTGDRYEIKKDIYDKPVLGKKLGAAPGAPGVDIPSDAYLYGPTPAQKIDDDLANARFQLDLAKFEQDLLEFQTKQANQLAPGALSDYQAGLLADKAATLGLDWEKFGLSQEKFGFEQEKWRYDNPPPLTVTTNPQNPNEGAQRAEWMAARVEAGENPYDYGAFAQHLRSLGAPEPSFEGFQQEGGYFQTVQGHQAEIDAAEQAYQNQLGIIEAQGQMNPWREAQMASAAADRQARIDAANQSYDIALRNFGLAQQQAAISAARAGNPLSYLYAIRGGPPPGTGGTEIYQGVNRVVPELQLPGIPTIQNPTPGLTTPGAGVTPGGTYNTVNGPKTLQQMEQELRAAGWQGGEDILQAYLRTTQPQTAPMSAASVPQTTIPSLGTIPLSTRTVPGGEGATLASPQRTVASLGQPPASGAPALPPGLATISRGGPLAPFALPSGSFRVPGVQAQANMAPAERSALGELLEFQGGPMHRLGFEQKMADVRQSMGPGLAPGQFRPSPLRRFAR